MSRLIADVDTTFFQAPGIDSVTEYPSPTDQPIRVVHEVSPIAELLAVVTFEAPPRTVTIFTSGSTTPPPHLDVLVRRLRYFWRHRIGRHHESRNQSHLDFQEAGPLWRRCLHPG